MIFKNVLTVNIFQQVRKNMGIELLLLQSQE